MYHISYIIFHIQHTKHCFAPFCSYYRYLSIYPITIHGKSPKTPEKSPKTPEKSPKTPGHFSECPKKSKKVVQRY